MGLWNMSRVKGYCELCMKVVWMRRLNPVFNKERRYECIKCNPEKVRI